jgi:hypothetical protein
MLLHQCQGRLISAAQLQQVTLAQFVQQQLTRHDQAQLLVYALPTSTSVPLKSYVAGNCACRTPSREVDKYCINCWSGPRCCSTSLMYAFAQRNDTQASYVCVTCSLLDTCSSCGWHVLWQLQAQHVPQLAATNNPSSTMRSVNAWQQQLGRGSLTSMICVIK